MTSRLATLFKRRLITVRSQKNVVFLGFNSLHNYINDVEFFISIYI